MVKNTVGEIVHGINENEARPAIFHGVFLAATVAQMKTLTNCKTKKKKITRSSRHGAVVNESD